MTGRGRRRAMARLAEGVYRVLLRLLPADLRSGWGSEMASTFAAEQRRILDERGVRVIGFWLREWLGLVVTALRARRPGGWAGRRMADGSGPGWNQERKAWRMMQQLIADIRFSARAFARRPALAGLAVLSLALGIGASTAMFSVVDTVLLRPLPFDDPHEIVSIYPTAPGMRGHPTLGGMAERATYSLPEFWWVAERQTEFDAVGAYIAYGGPTMAGDGLTPEQLTWVRATPGLLPVLGTPALRGRLFGEEDDPRNGARSVMLTERFWATRFAADPDMVGQTIRLNDVAYTVIGILPVEVAHATANADVWVLMTGNSLQGNWGNHNISGALGRLKDGVTLERARAGLAQLMAGVPAENLHEHGASVFPHLEDRTRGVRPALTALIGAAFLLLAVACGNVAALLIGAGIDREQEISVRSALGAGRRRLTRQFLTESLVLTATGAAAGVLVAFGVGEALVHLAPPGVPRIDQAGLDGRALLFTTGISALAGIAFGMIPALYLSRPEANPSIRSARGTTRGRGRLQALVVVGELAMATILLVSAALLARTLVALNRVELGIDADGLYEVRLAPQYQRFGELEDQAERVAAVDGYFQQLVDAVAGIPGVASVAVTDNVPLTSDRSNNDVVPEGWDAEAQNGNLIAERRFVSDNFFETTRIGLVEGRGFEPADNHANAAPVMIVSEGLARRAWPDQPAVGKRIRFWGRTRPPWLASPPISVTRILRR
ncbi:MAG: ABC transporter permease [Gemmatimonadetes bacterium]|nr:ABC transporter permease [Gemmatimonadota bacterium]